MTPTVPFRLRSLGLDLPSVAGAFGRRLHDAGVPVTAERAAWFAEALAAVEPISRRRLYWTARGVFVSDLTQVRSFDAVFASVFGAAPALEDATEAGIASTESAPTDEPRRTAEGAPRGGATATDSVTARPAEPTTEEIPVPVLASD